MKIRNILVVLIATFSIAACSSSGQNVLTTDQVADFLENGDLVLLDIRTPDEWNEGVIEGAVLKNFYDDDFADYLETLDKTQPVIITCKRGGRSGKATKMIMDAGFYEVYDMSAGMDGWNSDKKPTIKP